MTKDERREHMRRWRAENPERLREARRERERRRVSSRRKWAAIAAEAARQQGAAA